MLSQNVRGWIVLQSTFNKATTNYRYVNITGKSWWKRWNLRIRTLRKYKKKILKLILLSMGFIFFLSTTLYGAFEMAYHLQELGEIESAIWSGQFGFPFLHHYLWGVLGAGLTILILMAMFYRNEI